MVAVGEELLCERERPQNPMDPYAVVVKKDGITVSKSMLLIIRRCKKLHVLNFRCLAELRNFFTIRTFANYSIMLFKKQL